MELHSLSRGLPFSLLGLPNRHLVFTQMVSSSSVRLSGRRVEPELAWTLDFARRKFREHSLSRVVIVCSSSNSNSEANLEISGRQTSGVPSNRFDAVEPFRGKSGSVSFHGLTHQLVEEGKLMSAPFNEEKGSLLWLLAPASLISSLILPQFFLTDAIEAFFKNEILVEIVSSLVFEILFYVGLATFLIVTDRVQRPFLQFSTKRWGLITGLKGYLLSAFFTAGFKVIAPLFAVYVTWPMIGLPALVAAAPFVVSSLVQFTFEKLLDNNGASCWPLVPIIFEIYQIYQLTKAANFMERLMFGMKGLPASPELLKKSGALFGMIVTFQILGLVCLWSLTTFLLRLFPSRPIAENY